MKILFLLLLVLYFMKFCLYIKEKIFTPLITPTETLKRETLSPQIQHYYFT